MSEMPTEAMSSNDALLSALIRARQWVWDAVQSPVYSKDVAAIMGQNRKDDLAIIDDVLSRARPSPSTVVSDRPYLIEELTNEAAGIRQGQPCADAGLLEAAVAALNLVAPSAVVSDLVERLRDAEPIGDDFTDAADLIEAHGDCSRKLGMARGALEAMPDYIEVFRLMRDTGKTNRAGQAAAVAERIEEIRSKALSAIGGGE